MPPEPRLITALGAPPAAETGVHVHASLLVQAPRDAPAVLVVDLDLDQRRDWLELFPFLSTRRPHAYGALTSPGSASGPPRG
jgi:hypothetical protein